MKFIYHHEYLPMIEAKGEIFRVQILNHGNWKTLESEEAYQNFLADTECEE